VATNADTPKRVLVIDVGGRHVKMRMGTRAEVRRFPSGPELSAARMVEQVRAMTSDWSYDEELVNERARQRLGTKRWRAAVNEMVEHLGALLEVDSIVLGGGNAKELKSLPTKARRGDNKYAFVGGLRLWRTGAFLVCGTGPTPGLEP